MFNLYRKRLFGKSPIKESEPRCQCIRLLKLLNCDRDAPEIDLKMLMNKAIRAIKQHRGRADT